MHARRIIQFLLALLLQVPSSISHFRSIQDQATIQIQSQKKTIPAAIGPLVQRCGCLTYAKSISTMRGFIVAAALAIVGTLMVYMHSDYDNATDLRAYFPSRQLRPRYPKFINPSFTDPKNVMVKQDVEASFHGQNAPKESPILNILNELADINAWGTPAKLTSFGYKWRDDKCSIDETIQSQTKKRAALCLFGGISPYDKKLGVDGSNTPDVSDLSNFDWATALYDKNLLPEGDFELDLFIHSWSETYFCSVAKSFDDTRFTVRSIIAESSERHMNELFPLIRQQVIDLPVGGGLEDLFMKQASMYFSVSKALSLALDYSANCGFEYDLLIAGRPDVLLGQPITFYNKNGEKTRLHEALAPNNVVLHNIKMQTHSNLGHLYGDLRYIFNAATARTFVEKMFPPPNQKWPEIAKLTKMFEAHSGFIQELASNIAITMINDGLGPPHEEVIRKIWATKFKKGDHGLEVDENKMLRLLLGFRKILDFLGLPEHCFPSPPDGWQRHIDSNDPRCFPKLYDAQKSCPPNQNIHLSSTLP